MTDRELLELAAKAAGITVEWIDGHGMIEVNHDENATRGAWWNPLEEDAQAFRLAVDLGLVVDTSRTSAAQPLQQPAFAQADYTDRRAATRRAIVRAAASMAKEGT